jgi:hypothetical protein
LQKPALVSRPALEVQLQTFLVRQRRYRPHSAPIPAGLPKHIPLFRLRRLDFAFGACRLSLCFLFTGCSLSELEATAKLRNRSYSSNRNQLVCIQLLTTALRTKLGATLLFGVLKPTTDTTAYFHCLSLHLRMQKCRGQDKFLSALPRPPGGPYAVEKLLRWKFAKIELLDDALQTILLIF